MFQKNVTLGIAPIGWTNDDLPDLGGHIPFEQCVSEMALAGYTGTEIGNKYPKDPDVLREALQLRGLDVASAWFSAFLVHERDQTEADFRAHCAFLQAMGAKVVVVSEQTNSIQQMDAPLFEAKPTYTEGEWESVVSGLHSLGAIANEVGLSLVYHHHMGTCIQTAAEVDELMKRTDPSLVSLLYDTGHLVCSGEDELAVLDAHIERIKHVHLKDVRAEVIAETKSQGLAFLPAVREGIFTVPGDGSIDFTPVFERLSAARYEGWLLVEAEQDPARANPLAYAQKARQYIREKTGL
ncbi:myo-inosose-2 dehydratase [Aureibacillus halotolerans]|uniref:Inosose dehydratase n=1 Tax=Aureibacillus halotolerans TaxID=1508390 RepID=A0A4R6UD47_9BACI|nr:myo-inosose-2 dehydratase [Aureibacillus halotolerans]TDQ41024.1 2-keto-myo-inositol dehydratase [Aureibacillus halotolerans]